MSELDYLNRVAPVRRKRPPTPAHPLLGDLIRIIDGRRLNHRKLSIASGSNSSLVSNLRRGRAPILTTLSRLAALLGYDIVLKARDSDAPAAAWALRINGEIVDVTLDEKKTAAWAGKGWAVVRLTEEGE